MTNVTKSFDLVVFGATGFTGKYMVKLIASREDLVDKLNWAVAGRSLEKLRGVLKWVTSTTGKDLSHVSLLCADIHDEASLVAMCKPTKLLLNLVGPYLMYGESVVKACVENGCHHIDLCGNIQWLELMNQKYGQQAADAGVYCVAACGFDSIPVELGVIYTKKQFPGILNSVEGFFSVNSGMKNATINFATLHSMLYAIANRGSLKDIMEKCGRKPLPECLPKLPARKPVFFSDDNNRWSVLTGADEKVVARSQRFLYEENKERPIQYRASFSANSMWDLISIACILAGLVAFSIFRCGRALVKKYPRFFTYGIFSHEGPTQEQMDKTSFTFNFYGRGFSSKDKESQKVEDMKIVTSVNGPEFAYVATTTVMLEAGLTVLQEKDKLPPKGGIYSPAYAFYNSTIIERCDQQGVKFSVVSAAQKT